MSEQKFNIILTGYGSGKGKYFIESDLAEMFKIERRDARTLLEACPVTIKNELSESIAQRYIDGIEAVGATCEREDLRFDLGKYSIE